MSLETRPVKKKRRKQDQVVTMDELWVQAKVKFGLNVACSMFGIQANLMGCSCDHWDEPLATARVVIGCSDALPPSVFNYQPKICPPSHPMWMNKGSLGVTYQICSCVFHLCTFSKRDREMSFSASERQEWIMLVVIRIFSFGGCHSLWFTWICFARWDNWQWFYIVKLFVFFSLLLCLCAFLL